MLSPSDAKTPALADSVSEIREMSGLAVNDVAAMLGLRRRQFYNLLDNGTTSSDRNGRGCLHGVLADLTAPRTGRPTGSAPRCSVQTPRE